MSFDVKRWDGEKITESGIYVGIDMDAYHGDLCDGPSVSSSGLRDIFHKSPRAYFRGSYLNPTREVKKTSEAFIFGRGAHHLLLGEDNFRVHFAIRPEEYPADVNWGESYDPEGPHKAWSGNALWCKGWLAQAAKNKQTVLTANDVKMIAAMAQSLSEEPLVQAGILNGLIEHSFVWKDAATGVWLKWRPDNLPTHSLAFSDFKTTTSVEDEHLERAIGDFGYNMQGALGQKACRAILDRDMESFSLVFVEKEAVLPCVRTKTVRDADIALGLRQIDIALRLFRKSLDEGLWLGPGGEQHDNEYSGLNPRAVAKAEYRIAEIERQLAA